MNRDEERELFEFRRLVYTGLGSDIGDEWKRSMLNCLRERVQPTLASSQPEVNMQTLLHLRRMSLPPESEADRQLIALFDEVTLSRRRGLLGMPTEASWEKVRFDHLRTTIPNHEYLLLNILVDIGLVIRPLAGQRLPYAGTVTSLACLINALDDRGLLLGNRAAIEVGKEFCPLLARTSSIDNRSFSQLRNRCRNERPIPGYVRTILNSFLRQVRNHEVLTLPGRSGK